jgi:hypothetical protein
LSDRRSSIPAKQGKPLRRDYQYNRNGTRNLFVAVEPKGGYREVKVTERRKKKDFAQFIKGLVDKTYKKAKQMHIVLDNLNTHFENLLQETFGKKIAKQLLKRIVFHYTPYHASWLNMAEIEIGILSRQCIKGRIGTERELKQQIKAWQNRRNCKKAKIKWKFTRKKACKVFKLERLI